MDKNIAALLREDTKTVMVCFINDRYPGERDENDGGMTLLGQDFTYSAKAYRYVTDLDLHKDDLVVVYAVGIPKVAVVMEVEDDVNISPNEKTEYKWVVSKVDMIAYLENMKKNKAVKDLVAKGYKRNLKRQFAQVLLEGMDENERLALNTVLTGEKK